MAGGEGRGRTGALIIALASVLALVPALAYLGLDLLASRPTLLTAESYCEASPALLHQSAAGRLTLRYQISDGRFVRLRVEPFRIGPNVFQVWVLNPAGERVSAELVRLGFYRLEDHGPVEWVEVRPPAEVSRILGQTGWWVVAVSVDGGEPVPFVVRLDEPSRAPMEFAPPDYPADPAAEAFFRRALATVRSLKAAWWEEQLTSGLAYPSELGAWVVVRGKAEAPDRFRLEVSNPERESYDVFQAGRSRCVRRQGEGWVCSDTEPRSALAFGGLAGARAFRFGRQETVDGELTQVVTFYEPVEKSWYAWWVGLETGYLRRMAMVGPGHFMVTRYFGHNDPAGQVVAPIGD